MHSVSRIVCLVSAALQLLSFNIAFVSTRTPSVKLFHVLSSSCTIHVSSHQHINYTQEESTISKFCFKNPNCVLLLFTPQFNYFVANLELWDDKRRLFNESAYWDWKISAPIHHRSNCIVKVADIQIISTVLNLTALVETPANRIGAPDYLLIFGIYNNKLFYHDQALVIFPASTTSKVILVLRTEIQDVDEGEVFMVCIICGQIIRTLDRLEDILYPPSATGILEEIKITSNISSLQAIDITWLSINAIRTTLSLKSGQCDVFHELGYGKVKEMVRSILPFRAVSHPEDCAKQILNWRLNCSSCVSNSVFTFGAYEMYRWPYWEMSPFGSYSIGFGYVLFVGKELASISKVVIFQSLDNLVWFFIIAAYIFMNVALSATKMRVPWFWSAAFLLEQGTSLKSNWRNVHLIILWCFAALLFRNAYTGNMYLNLTSKPTQRFPETLEEVVNHPKFELFSTIQHFSMLSNQVKVTQKEFNNSIEFLSLFSAKLKVVLPKLLNVAYLINKNLNIPGPRRSRSSYSTENFAWMIAKGGIPNFRHEDDIVANDILTVFGNKKVIFNSHVPFLTTLNGWKVVRNGFMHGGMTTLKSYVEAGLDFHIRGSLKGLYTSVFLQKANLQLKMNKSWNFFKISTMPLLTMWEEKVGSGELDTNVDGNINRIVNLDSLMTIWLTYAGCVVASTGCFLVESIFYYAYNKGL